VLLLLCRLLLCTNGAEVLDAFDRTELFVLHPRTETLSSGHKFNHVPHFPPSKLFSAVRTPNIRFMQRAGHWSNNEEDVWWQTTNDGDGT